jgi:hypothetical protein
MLYKNWTPRVTKISAPEADAIARLLQLHNAPGLIGHADLAKCLRSGTTMTCHAFDAGDKILTGLAVCESYQIAGVDFATAGNGGGALPAGTYSIYLDVIQSTGAAKRYLCFPRAVNAAAILQPDPKIYLIVRTGVIWDGEVITDQGEDARAGKWGPLDLTALGRGDDDAVLVGDDRDWRFAGPVYFDGAVFSTAQTGINAEQYLSLGSLTGGGIFNILDDSTFWTGDNFDWILYGAMTLDATSHPLKQIMGNGSILQMLNGAKIQSVAGETLHDLLTFGSGLATINDATPLAFESCVLAGTPIKNQFHGAAQVKARARVSADGSIISSLNIYGVTKSATGVYAVVYKRRFAASDDYECQVTAASDAKVIGTALGGASGCTVYLWNDSGAVDCTFNLTVFGGDQAADVS